MGEVSVTRSIFFNFGTIMVFLERVTVKLGISNLVYTLTLTSSSGSVIDYS